MVFRYTQNNYNTVAAKNAALTIVEAEEIVPVGRDGAGGSSIGESSGVGGTGNDVREGCTAGPGAKKRGG